MSNKIKEFFEENYIEGIVFDLDGTLVDTSKWLKYMYKEISSKIVPYINKEYNLQVNVEDFTQAYYQAEVLEYKNGNVNFVTRFSATLSHISNTLKLNMDTNALARMFLNNVSQIYTLSPDPCEGTLKLLNTLLQFTNVAICTHSGKDWTKIKMDHLKSKYKEKYGDIPILHSHYIPLNEPKDASEWINASKKINSTPENLIAVGDSFTADIIPSVEAGYRYIVWITKDSIDKEQDIKELRNIGCKITTTEHIKELEGLLTSNQPFEDT